MKNDAPLQKKRLMYQSLHRGTKENDHILGRFARAHLESLSGDQLSAYEKLLEEPDGILFLWFTGQNNEIPAEYDNLVRMIKAANA